MKENIKIFAIIGSASDHSANLKLVEYLSGLFRHGFHLQVYHQLKQLPHFDPELSLHNTPPSIVEFRKAVEQADGVLICSPEYVFSIPSGLKNAIEWCVSTTVFSDKPVGLITASADGRSAHQELILILKTIMAKLSDQTNLLIQGVKGKVDRDGTVKDKTTKEELEKFVLAFEQLIEETTSKKASAG